MHLGLFAISNGNHIAGWRYPGSPRSGEDFNAYRDMARTAEAAKFDFIFVADNVACSPDDHPGYVARPEPLTLMSALATATSRLGLVATASTTYSAPYNLARQFSTLDHISGGRAAWNVVTSSSEPAAANFNLTQPFTHEQRYEMAAEFVEVVQGLWDSWESGARVADTETGQYLDPRKIHALNHAGRYFSVRGPLNCSRSPQGQPVIVQAGSSTSGQKFAARFAEVMFTVQQDIEEAKAFYKTMKTQVVAAGRDASGCKILPGILPVVGRTESEAREKLNSLMRYVDSKNAMRAMTERFGFDMSQFPLDGPVPDLPIAESSIQSYSRVLLSMARRENYKLRDLYNIIAVSRGYIVACGTPDKIADMMERWVKEEAADGFIITPAYFPAYLDDFVEGVVPELRRRKLFRTEYEGATLRDQLGLSVPVNRFSRAGGERAASA
ncbi:MAG: LLM class flavin-dependent oxidoreductase [Pseudorhodoplanes sp.]